jgi:hypothetical protein
MGIQITETTSKGVDKTSFYGWVTKDQPGILKILNKDILKIHPAYQRDLITKKVKEITANWSWVAAGVIVIGERNGEFWVIDGQHRVQAAKRRSDITNLPCIVFQTENIKQEAVGFLDLNTGRKPVTSLGKFKALIAAGDDSACIVNKTLLSLGVTITSTATKGRDLKSVAWAIKKAGEDAKKFNLVMSIAADLCFDMPISEKLLDGLWYINDRLEGGIGQKRFYDRANQVGAKKLHEAAQKAASYFVTGGAKVWATGMIDVINKGLRNKFNLRSN